MFGAVAVTQSLLDLCVGVGDMADYFPEGMGVTACVGRTGQVEHRPLIDQIDEPVDPGACVSRIEAVWAL